MQEFAILSGKKLESHFLSISVHHALFRTQIVSQTACFTATYVTQSSYQVSDCSSPVNVSYTSIKSGQCYTLIDLCHTNPGECELLLPQLDLDPLMETSLRFECSRKDSLSIQVYTDPSCQFEFVNSGSIKPNECLMGVRYVCMCSHRLFLTRWHQFKLACSQHKKGLYLGPTPFAPHIITQKTSKS